MKVVLDTNVLIAALRSKRGASFRILIAIFEKRIIPVLSNPLVTEYEAVAKRPQLVPHLTPQQIDDILNVICLRAVEQKIHYLYRPLLKDPGDDMLVELALGASCRYIVTHNIKDFLPAKAHGIEPILPNQLIKIFKDEFNND